MIGSRRFTSSRFSGEYLLLLSCIARADATLHALCRTILWFKKDNDEETLHPLYLFRMALFHLSL